jgi:hypothetical protein
MSDPITAEPIARSGHQPMEAYPGPTTGGRPIYDGRFNVSERRPTAERVDV